MRVFRYPLRALVGDYIRSSIGVAVGLSVLLTVPASTTIIVIFGGVTLAFLIFGLRTVQHHVMQVALTEEGLGCRDFRTRALPWDDLSLVKLRFFGTRKQAARDDGSGFMQITLKGAGVSMTFESSLEGFELLAWRATKAARDNGVSLDPATAGNFLQLGIDADGDVPPPGNDPDFSH